MSMGIGMEFTIRQAHPEDAELLHDHIRRLLEEPGIPIPLQPEEFTLTVDQQRQILTDAPCAACAVCFVAEADGQIIGEINFKCGTRRAFSHVATLGMSVKSEWRRKGVGRELLEAALEWAPTAGIKRVELYVYARNAPAIALYERTGFVHEGRRRNYIREGTEYLDDLVMARWLD